MATYHYHYCIIRQIADGQTSYTSGMYQTDTKIKFGQPYDVFIDSFKQRFGLTENDPVDFIVSSLALLDEEI